MAGTAHSSTRTPATRRRTPRLAASSVRTPATRHGTGRLASQNTCFSQTPACFASQRTPTSTSLSPTSPAATSPKFQSSLSTSFCFACASSR
ncbi:hypothetical protein DAI22_04g186200 [Oryza sativa Japonica Group]|nr:hypothetical protein DAI22_04g186200 [Oryza sativa Japonica Group]